MAYLYATLIAKGLKKYKDVMPKYKPEVKRLLQEVFCCWEDEWENEE